MKTGKGTRGEIGQKEASPEDVSMWHLARHWCMTLGVQTFNLNSAMLCLGDLKANFIIKRKKKM